jgi:antitoxin component YwqK of YwqJK toxin-antitoxin module
MVVEIELHCAGKYGPVTTTTPEHTEDPMYACRSVDSAYDSRPRHASWNYDPALKQTLLRKEPGAAGRFVPICLFHSEYSRLDDANYDQQLSHSLKAEYELVDGRIHGVFRLWHKDVHMIAEATYKHGELHGESKCWWIPGTDNSDLWIPVEKRKVQEPGILRMHCHYESGVMVGEKRNYYKDGALYVNRQYDVSGRQGGDTQLYHANGKRMFQGTMAAWSSCVGREWHKNGKLKFESVKDDEGLFHLLKFHSTGKPAYAGNFRRVTSNTSEGFRGPLGFRFQQPVGIHKRHRGKDGNLCVTNH